MKNHDIRSFARKKGVPLWEVAHSLGISEPTITRRLRQELPATEKEKIRLLINGIAEGRQS